MFIFAEKNPFTQRRQTASQNFSYKDEPSKKEHDSESESDDFDEFYNDKSFLNTGMGSGNRMTYQGAPAFENNNDTQSYLNRVSYSIFINFSQNMS